MGRLDWVRMACGVLGAAGLLWVEWKTYRERVGRANEPWWAEGLHDEVKRDMR